MILDIKTRQLDPGLTMVEMVGRMSLGGELTYAGDRIIKLIAGGQLRLPGPAPEVAKLFTITHLNKIVPIDPGVATAARAFRQAQATGA